MKKGYVHVYTGNGKGKTTAMLGLTLRASGAGLRTYIGQFIKNGEYCEVKSIKKYLPCVKIEQYGTSSALINRDVTEKDIEAAQNGLRIASEAMFSGEYDVVMLDEINIAIYYNLISVDSVIELIKKKPCNIELVLTGRHAAEEIIEAADLVSEVTEIKHYYDDNIEAREGIEK